MCWNAARFLNPSNMGASMLLLYQFAEVLLKSCQSCIMESTFYPALAARDFQQLWLRTPFSPVQIHCQAEIAVLAERVRQRWESGERHRGHMEDLRDPGWYLTLSQEHLRPLPLDGLVIELDTTGFARIDYELLFTCVQDALDAKPSSR